MWMACFMGFALAFVIVNLQNENFHFPKPGILRQIEAIHRCEVGFHDSGCQLSPGLLAFAHGSSFSAVSSVEVGFVSDLVLSVFGAVSIPAAVGDADAVCVEFSPFAASSAGRFNVASVALVAGLGCCA
jgi:hypothetical protein